MEKEVIVKYHFNQQLPEHIFNIIKQESETEKLEKIIQLINLQDEKSNEDVESIKSFLGNHYSYLRNIFKKLDQKDSEILIQNIKCETYANNQYIENQGIQSSRLGIVMKGRVKINSSNNGKKRQHHENKMVVKQGDRIGLDSILLQKPSLYSLSADSEQVVLLSINKQQFEKHIKPIEQERFDSCIDFLKQCQLFKHINNDSILTMILYNSVKIQFETGEVVYSQDQNSYAIYIVLQGKFQVTKKFLDEQEQPINQSQITNGESEENSSRNQRNSIYSDQNSFTNNNQTTLKLRVAEAYDVFGEEEVIDMKPRVSSVVCTQDSSQLLVVRPVVYKSCILNDEFIKKKLIEIVGQKHFEIKEKEHLKKHSYQSLGSRSRKSSFITVSTPKANQGHDNKESKFAKEYKQNSYCLSSDSSISPRTINGGSSYPSMKSNLNSHRENTESQSNKNTLQIDLSKELDSFGGYIQYQDTKHKESPFNVDISQKLSRINSQVYNLQSPSTPKITPRGVNDSECNSPFIEFTQIEVSGKQIKRSNFLNKDNNNSFRQQMSKLNSLPKKADFQVGPYQQQLQLIPQDILDETPKSCDNTTQSLQSYQIHKKLKGSPFTINIKTKDIDEKSQRFGDKSKKNQLQHRREQLTNRSEEKVNRTVNEGIIHQTIDCLKLIKNDSDQMNFSMYSHTPKVRNSPNFISRSAKFISHNLNTPTNSSFFNKSQLSPQVNPEFLLNNESSTFQRNDRQTTDSKKQIEIEPKVIFSSKNSLPISNINKKLRYSSHTQKREYSQPNQKILDNLQNKQRHPNQTSSGFFNRPAIIVPNSLPLVSPISNIYSTQLNLTCLQQLKDSNYQNKPFLIEKFAFVNGKQQPNQQQIDLKINTQKLFRNKSQNLQNKLNNNSFGSPNQIK